MKIACVEIENFRCVQKIEIPLSSFTCIVGHNNAGKSTVLTALSLFVNGSKIGKGDFFDPEREVVIRATIEQVTDDALSPLNADHRDRLKELVKNETLTLIRRYTTDGASTLRCIRMVPLELRFQDEHIKTVLANKRGAATLARATTEAYPELEGKLDGLTVKEKFVAAIEGLRDTLPAEKLELQEAPLPTGIDNSIVKLLPEPILIPAVKDVTDEVKTKEAASFGKILKIMLESLAEAERMKVVIESHDAERPAQRGEGCCRGVGRRTARRD